MLIKDKRISWCISSISYRGFSFSHHFQSNRDINCSFHNNLNINSWVYSTFQNIKGKTLHLRCLGDIRTYSNSCCIIQSIRCKIPQIYYSDFIHHRDIHRFANRRISSIYSKYNSIMFSFLEHRKQKVIGAGVKRNWEIVKKSTY
jgi:hypothetical protein